LKPFTICGRFPQGGADCVVPSLIVSSPPRARREKKGLSPLYEEKTLYTVYQTQCNFNVKLICKYSGTFVSTTLDNMSFLVSAPDLISPADGITF